MDIAEPSDNCEERMDIYSTEQDDISGSSTAVEIVMDKSTISKQVKIEVSP